MALTTQRDDAEVAAGLVRWFARDQGRSDLTIVSLDRPSAGYSSETVLVEIAWSEEGVRQGASLVIRMAPAEAGTFADYDVVPQWEAQVAAAAAGVPVADPVVETDAQWLGAPFLVMPRVSGHIIGELPHRDRWLGGLSPSDRGRLYRTFIITMSTVHRADAGRAVDVPHRDNTAEMDFWDEYLMWSSDGSPVPVLVSALQWCRRHRPATEPDPVLLWGDARFENVVFGDDLDPLAVLDWDMTSIGAPQHDLAWFTSLDLIVSQLLGTRLPGFPDRVDTIRQFESCADRPVPDLEWYETLAMVRSTAVMTRIGYLRKRAGEPLLLPIEDNPILDIVKSRIA
jgi:aminoglycoside phosphotransferase (APT) family kinase protein